MTADIDYSQMDVTELQDLLVQGQSDAESAKILEAMRAKCPPNQNGACTEHVEKLLDAMGRNAKTDEPRVTGDGGTSPTLEDGLDEARRQWQETLGERGFGPGKQS